MRRLFALLMTLLLLLSTALAEPTLLNPQEERGIVPVKEGLNEVPEGTSPTTGRSLAHLYKPEGYAGLAITGRYLPMLVQIGNDGGGIGDRSPWGLTYADIVYESPLTRDFETRMTFVFSDLIPDSVGFVRSARIGHVWLREEWDGGFLFYGQQEAEGSNVKEELKRLGVREKELAFSGTTGGTPWKQYYTSRKRLKSPYDVDANVAAMSRLVPEDHVAPNHAYRFTDEAPEGDTANYVYVNWGASAANYNSRLVYRAEWDGYIRNVGKDKSDWYQDRDGDAGAVAFQNVIVQFTRVEYNHHSKLEPIMYVADPDGASIGGNADYFMCGKHISGYWQRDSMSDRTVYYDSTGHEISLQKGRTLILIFPDDGQNGKSVSYE